MQFVPCVRRASSGGVGRRPSVEIRTGREFAKNAWDQKVGIWTFLLPQLSVAWLML